MFVMQFSLPVTHIPHFSFYDKYLDLFTTHLRNKYADESSWSQRLHLKCLDHDKIIVKAAINFIDKWILELMKLKLKI